MLHQLLRLTRPLIVVDVETTGLKYEADRIVEIGAQVWKPEGLTKEWRTLVNPGVPIPEAVTKVHGITDEAFKKCRKCSSPLEKHPIGSHAETFEAGCIDPTPWPTFKQLAPNLVKGFTGVDFAGKNVRFDLRFFAAEFARAGVEWSTVGARIVDADRLEQLGEPRHLSNLYEKHVGRKLEDAHQALADVRATAEVIEVQLRKYAMLPRDLDMLHKAQWGDTIDAEGKFQFIDGVACFGNWSKKHPGKPMAWVAKNDPGYYRNFILGETSNFLADVKALAREALAGRFPEAK